METERITQKTGLPQEEYDIVYSQLGRVISQWRVHTQAEQKFLPSAYLESIEKNFEELHVKHRTQCFVVALIALCKSGKSTFLNALMGCDYLPSHNLPETSRIVRVQHTVDCPTGRLTDKETNSVVVGSKEIREQLHQKNREARESGDPSEKELLLEAPFVSLHGKSFDKQSFAVLDTPGPNEAKGMTLMKLVNNIMDKADVILYLLDYTKLRTREEEDMFSTLRSLRADLCENFHDRLFLIVNKIDLKNRHGLSAEQTVNYIANLISSDIPELKITPDKVLLVSAENALLARQVQNGTATPLVKLDFCQKLYGMMCDDDVPDDKLKRDAHTLLSRSGFQEMERHVLSFMFDNKASILIESVVGDALRHMFAFNNYLMTCRGALKSSKNDQEIKKLKTDLDHILKGFSTIKEVFKKTITEMEEWVDGRFNEFEEKCNTELERIIKTFPDFTVVGAKREDVACILVEKNANLAQDLTEKFSNFKAQLEKEAFVYQETLYKDLKSEIQPFVQQVEKQVGEFLDISDNLYPVSVEFPKNTRECFNATIDEQLASMVKTAKGSVTYEEQRTGLCHWLKRKVTIPVDLYASSPSDILQYWNRLLHQNTLESSKTAKLVVETKVSGALGVAEDYLKNYIEGYSDTIEYTIRTFNANETRRRNRLMHVESLVKDIHTGVRQLVDLNPKLKQSDWIKRYLDSMKADEDLLDEDDEDAVEVPLKAPMMFCGVAEVSV